MNQRIQNIVKKVFTCANISDVYAIAGVSSAEDPNKKKLVLDLYTRILNYFKATHNLNMQMLLSLRHIPNSEYMKLHQNVRIYVPYL